MPEQQLVNYVKRATNPIRGLDQSSIVERRSESLLLWETEPVESPLKGSGAVDKEMNEHKTSWVYRLA